jgi:rhomboid family GlyGly-CTERM serine protease
VILGTAVVSQLFPAVAAVLVYDRLAILGGEIWRLATGHLVHFSAAHFVSDALALGLLGAWVEWRGPRVCALIYVALALVIGLGLLVIEPDMRYFGGLSGMAYGLAAYLLICGACREGQLRMLWVVVFLMFISRVAAEQYFREALFVAHQADPFIPVPLSHMLGVSIAAVVFLFQQVGLNK